MNELLKAPEHHELLEAHAGGEQQQPSVEKSAEAPHQFEHEHQQNQAEIEQTIQEQAISGKEINVTEQEGAPSHHPASIDRQFKIQALRRNLTSIRRHLNKPEKLASKVIHQPVISKISELSEDTLARPSGLLGGGIAALVGSSLLLYLAKHYGFEYNFLAFFMLFAGGFLLGILGEFGTKLIKR